MSGRNSSRNSLERDLRMSHLIAEIGGLAAEEAEAHADFAEAIKPHETEREAQLAAIAVKKQAAVNELLTSIREGYEPGKDVALKLPSGVVTLSTSSSALDISDPSAFMELARRLKMVNRVSSIKPREPNKTMIKAAIKNFPRFYRAVQHLLVQPRTTTLTIKPRNYGGEEIKVEVRKFNVPYPAPKTAIEPRTPSS